MAARKLKSKPCRVCKCEFKPRRSTQVVCSPGCAKEYVVIKQQAKDRKVQLQRKRERIATKKAFRDKDKKFHMKKAVMTYNRYIVKVRDKDLPCISSGRTTAVQWHCGHYIPGTVSALRFDEANTHKQSSEDNLYRSGNLTEYRINLIEKIGIDEVERLEGPQEQKKWTIEELKAIRSCYGEKLKSAGVPVP